MIQFLLVFFVSLGYAAQDYSCETKFDHLEIPHIKASSMEEFYYCFGVAHGRDRAWEMDYFRRSARGQNAELYGFSQLKNDLLMRLLNLSGLAEKIWNEFEDKKWLELYSAGVNEGFKTGRFAFEFKDKNYTPAPWKPQDSILILLLQSFDQTRRSFLRDYDEEILKEDWDEKSLALFDDDDVPWETTILKEGEYPKRKGPPGKTVFQRAPLQKLWASFPSVFGKESGSNNWTVSKRKSKNGRAFFANDPHLDLKTPLFWYWISIHSPSAKLIGGSVPGVPVVATGTNGKVAWGLTNSYFNSADAVFVKNLKDEDLESVRPTVKVKFAFFTLPFFFKSFERLKDGTPVLPFETESEHKLLLRWTGFTLKAKDFYPMFDLFHVKNVEEMDQLLTGINIPSWNFVFADTKGEIGYRMVGKTYKMAGKNPFGVSVMSLEEFQNPAYLEPSERPHLLKPKREYILTANNRHWPKDALYYGGRGYSQSFRAFRIEELLKDSKHDQESFKKIQCDEQVVDARFFIPKIQEYFNMPEFEKWNMMTEDHSHSLPVYRRLMDILMEEWDVNEYALYRLLDDLDAEKVEDLKDFYQEALADVHGRTWGEIHRVNFPHLSKNQNWNFSPDVSGVGDTHTVNPGTAVWSLNEIYRQTAGASMRMIIEMSEVPKIWLNLPGRNRNYLEKKQDNPWLQWKNCQYSQVEF